MNKQLIGIFLTVNICLPLSGCANQQLQQSPTQVSPGMSKSQSKAMLFQQLGLNDNQKKQVQAILKDEHMKMKAVKVDNESRMQAMLTPEQLASFNAIPPQQRKLSTITQQLGLNDGQKTQVEAIFKAEAMKSKAIRTDKKSRLQSVLTPEQMTNFEAMEHQHTQLLRNGGGNNPQ